MSPDNHSALLYKLLLKTAVYLEAKVMTQYMHNFIGLGLYGITWVLVLKKYFVRPEEVQWWTEWLDKKIFKD